LMYEALAKFADIYLYLETLFEIKDFDLYKSTYKRPTKTWTIDEEIVWLRIIWEAVVSTFRQVDSLSQKRFLAEYKSVLDQDQVIELRTIIESKAEPTITDGESDQRRTDPPSR